MAPALIISRTCVFLLALFAVAAHSARLRLNDGGNEGSVTLDSFGNVHITSTPNQTIYLNGIDIALLAEQVQQLLTSNVASVTIVQGDDQNTAVLDSSSPQAFTTAGVYRLVPNKNIPVTFKVWGAGGGSSTLVDSAGRGRPDGDNHGSTSRNIGGGGGFAFCTMTLTVGQTYTVVVGSGGQTYTGNNYPQGSGGGYSGVFVSDAEPSQSNALLVAGGGGGGGFGDWSRPGGGGGASGQDASYNSHRGTGAPAVAAGRGGSASGGGAAGADTGGGTGNPGDAGGPLSGGRSAGSSPTDSSACASAIGGGGCAYDCSGGSYDGGGGGGGYWGGGGGSCHWAGSGGGGSGYIKDGVCTSYASVPAFYELPAASLSETRAAHGPDAGSAGKPGLVVMSLGSAPAPPPTLMILDAGGVTAVDLSGSMQSFATAGVYRLVAEAEMKVTFKVWGAGGGSSTLVDSAGRGRPDGDNHGSTSRNIGGGGGFAFCTMTLTVGQTYTVVVGSGGQTYTGNNYPQGSGGGYSGVFVSDAEPSQSNALLVAGGGGGGGFGDWSRPGGGGGASGQDASYNSHRGTGAPAVAAGRGGSASGGGAAGADTGGGTGNPGDAGGPLSGGRSAGSSPTDSSACASAIGGGGCAYDCSGGSYDGGGGGGGYWGGGGGSCHWAGSGGGGSGYIKDGVCTGTDDGMASANFETPAAEGDPDRAAHGSTAGTASHAGLVLLKAATSR